MKLDAKQIIKRLEVLKGERGVWENHWQDLADYILPRKNEIVTKNSSKGRKKGEFLFDSTAMISCELLAGALHGLLTNPSEIWFDLTTGDEDLDTNKDMSEYLQSLTKQVHDVLNASNFQTEIHELYLDLCSLGTSVMTVLEDDQTAVRFGSKNLANCYISENGDGRVEELYRTFKWTARQIIAEFADGVKENDKLALEDKFGKHLVAKFLKGDNERFEVVHAVYKEDVANKTMPFTSQYVLTRGLKELRDGKFKTFPYVTPRWTKVAEETYGRSPGMNALPEAKTLNAMTKAIIKGAQKTVDPPLQMPDDGVLNPRIAQPGGISYYRAGSKDRIEPIFRDVQINVGVEVTRDRQQSVRQAFFSDQLQLIENTNMTATEVNRRTEERMRLLGPVLGRQQSELLRPLISRVLDIMVSKGLVAEPPADIPNGLSIQYSSPIARAQKVDQGKNLLRAFEASLPFLEQLPQGMDNIDIDSIINSNWKIYGAPMKVLRGAQGVEQLRDARAKAQEKAIKQQQEQAEAEQVSSLSKAIPQQQ